jgi:hypothetical protein
MQTMRSLLLLIFSFIHNMFGKDMVAGNAVLSVRRRIGVHIACMLLHKPGMHDTVLFHCDSDGSTIWQHPCFTCLLPVYKSVKMRAATRTHKNFT